MSRDLDRSCPSIQARSKRTFGSETRRYTEMDDHWDRMPRPDWCPKGDPWPPQRRPDIPGWWYTTMPDASKNSMAATSNYDSRDVSGHRLVYGHSGLIKTLFRLNSGGAATLIVFGVLTIITRIICVCSCVYSRGRFGYVDRRPTPWVASVPIPGMPLPYFFYPRL